MVRFIVRILFCSTFLLAISSVTVFAQNNWSPDTIGFSQPVNSLVISASGDIFAGAQSAGNGGIVLPTGVFHSTNKGTSWTQCQNGNTLGPIYGIDSKKNIFAGGGYLQYVSTNNGTSWQSFHIEAGAGQDPVIDPTADAFTIAPNGYIFVASNSGPLWVSSDYGADWDNEGVDNNSGFTYPTFVSSSSSGNVFAGTSQLLFHAASALASEAWNPVSGAPALGTSVRFAFSSKNMIVAGGTGGLYVSIDNGSNWSQITPPAANENTHYALAIGQNGNVFAGMSTGGISVSVDTGKDWTDISSGITTAVNTLAINSDGTLFAGTNNGVFQYLTSTGSGVNPTVSAAPASLSLDQNSPNPVTGSTTIHFAVPEAGQVSLKVFDATGREMATVASGFHSPGTYNVSFDSHGLPNGTYYFRITSGSQSATRMFAIEH